MPDDLLQLFQLLLRHDREPKAVHRVDKTNFGDFNLLLVTVIAIVLNLNDQLRLAVVDGFDREAMRLGTTLLLDYEDFWNL